MSQSGVSRVDGKVVTGVHKVYMLFNYPILNPGEQVSVMSLLYPMCLEYAR
jgi:hypothetical protein